MVAAGTSAKFGWDAFVVAVGRPPPTQTDDFEHHRRQHRYQLQHRRHLDPSDLVAVVVGWDVVAVEFAVVVAAVSDEASRLRSAANVDRNSVAPSHGRSRPRAVAHRGYSDAAD